MSRSQRALLGLLIVLLVAIGVVLAVGRPGSTSARQPALLGPTLPSNDRAPAFTLTDQDGRAVSLSAYRGRVIVMSFVHSQCKGICPFMVEGVKGALDDLGSAGRQVAFLGITVAPGEDSAAQRRAFVAKHRLTGRMEYLSAAPAVMRRVWRGYAIAPETHGEDHSAFVFLIDRGGVIRVGYPAGELVPESLAHDLRTLLSTPARQ